MYRTNIEMASVGVALLEWHEWEKHVTLELYAIIHMGDSMSKVREKRSQSKSGFFYEMPKIIRQMDDFGRFLNNFFFNFGEF